tara:strand:+ start:203 stop:454 length:252 start_codon:yes stop_codon:yes gene_type:complete
MPAPHDKFSNALSTSDHVRTIASLMHQQDIDVSIAPDATHGGIPYVVIVVQGQFAQVAEEWAIALASHFRKRRNSARADAQRG